MTPLEQKRQYRAYRLAARRHYQNVLCVDTKHISVTDDCSVQRVQDGAYVQMVVWIPIVELTPEVYEEVLKEERERKTH